MINKTVKFVLRYGEYWCRYGTVWIEDKTRYISNGTYIFWGAKTLLVSEFMPDDTGTGDLIVTCVPLEFDSTYYEVLSISVDGRTYQYSRVSVI